MSKFIVLHSTNGTAIYFNSRHITRFFRSDNSTRIHVTGLEVAVIVTETPEEILRLIQE